LARQLRGLERHTGCLWFESRASVREALPPGDRDEVHARELKPPGVSHPHVRIDGALAS
jgi:hypothetical protein